MTSLSTSLDGMNQAINSLNSTASSIAQAGSTPPASKPSGSPPPSSAGDTVTLSDDMVSLMNASNNFEANAKTAEVSDQTAQYTLNMMG